MKRFLLLVSVLFIFNMMFCSCNSISSIIQNQEKKLSNKNTVYETNSKIDNKKINYDNVNGVWISYLEYGWIMTEKNEDEFKNNIISVFENLVSKKINTVIVQVRSHSDAYYNSQYYPWSKYVTGNVSKAPTYDPLKIMIQEAHKRDLSIHAWINPYRVMTDELMKQVPDNYCIKKWYKNTQYMVKHENYWYLNPSNQEVQNLIVNGVNELCTNYDIDGIQIDDYFYVPSPQQFNCDISTAQNSTTELVQKIYNTIKKINNNILFGVSPAGNYTDKPKSDTTQYTQLELWCTQEGYIDYVAPQIYWSCDDEVAPFETILEKWENLCKNNNIDLIVGLAGYKFSQTNELNKQIDIINNNDNTNGYIIFRYDNIK